MPDNDLTIHAIAHIESDFKEKFGIPRQSGLVDALRARVVFEPPYRDPSALRGIQQVQPSVAGVAVHPGGAGQMEPHGPAAPGWAATQG